MYSVCVKKHVTLVLSDRRSSQSSLQRSCHSFPPPVLISQPPAKRIPWFNVFFPKLSCGFLMIYDLRSYIHLVNFNLEAILLWWKANTYPSYTIFRGWKAEENFIHQPPSQQKRCQDTQNQWPWYETRSRLPSIDWPTISFIDFVLKYVRISYNYIRVRMIIVISWWFTNPGRLKEKFHFPGFSR